MANVSTGGVICCGECSSPIPPEYWNQEANLHCLTCGCRVMVVAFPAIARKPAGMFPDAIELESEASCFYHPQSRATVPCEECGRFLCRLCDLEIDGEHLCPQCFQSGVRTRKLTKLETRRTMYDTIALALAAWPALLIWPAVLTAPASLFIVFRRWRAPGSLVPRTRIRFYLAGLFALAEIAFATFTIWTISQLSGRSGGR